MLRRMFATRKATARTALWLCLALAAGCRATERRSPGDPTVRLFTGGAGELGVSTEYGIVFLGLGRRGGDVEFTSWFGDGPSLETGIVEPLGGGLFLTRAEIRVPTAALSFDEPAAGDQVRVRGRRGPRGAGFSFTARVERDERVEGLLLRPEGDLDDLGAAETGAGVYVEREGVEHLVGLLSGRLTLPGADGERRYYTVAGARDLWRLVAYPRDPGSSSPTQRGDVLP